MDASIVLWWIAGVFGVIAIVLGVKMMFEKKKQKQDDINQQRQQQHQQQQQQQQPYSPQSYKPQPQYNPMSLPMGQLMAHNQAVNQWGQPIQPPPQSQQIPSQQWQQPQWQPQPPQSQFQQWQQPQPMSQPTQHDMKSRYTLHADIIHGLNLMMSLEEREAYETKIFDMMNDAQEFLRKKMVKAGIEAKFIVE